MPEERTSHPSDNPKADVAAAKARAKAMRPWFRKKRWWVAGVVAVGALGSQVATGDEASDTAVAEDSSATQDTKGTGSGEETTPTKQRPVQVRAAAIVKEFEANELSADAKYEGRSLEITGVVVKIDTEVFDDQKYVLELGGGGDFELLSVSCYDMPNDELATFDKGDRITVVGEFDDGGDLGVDVRECHPA